MPEVAYNDTCKLPLAAALCHLQFDNRGSWFHVCETVAGHFFGEKIVSSSGGSDDAGGFGDGDQTTPSNEAISHFVLTCVQALNNSYPNPVDIAGLAIKVETHPVGDQVLGLLRESGFISGPTTQTVLTLRGLQSLRSASQSDYRVAQMLTGQTVTDPNAALLSILRADFYNRNKDAFGGL